MTPLHLLTGKEYKFQNQSQKIIILLYLLIAHAAARTEQLQGV